MASKTIGGDEYNHFLSHGEAMRRAMLAGWGLEGEPKVSVDGDRVTLDDGREEPRAEAQPPSPTAEPDPQPQRTPYADGGQ
jgi:hypothetical protein